MARVVGESQPTAAAFMRKAKKVYKKMRQASAADLKFLQRLPQARLGTSNRKAALKS
jgi:hypothetical protein